MSKKKILPEFDKYEHYHRSVQSADNDVKFLRKAYKQLRNKKPVTMREDFCGTFSLSCEWVKLKKEHQAIGVDLDPEPIEYGRKKYLSQLSPEEQSRVKVMEGNVLDSKLPKADIIQAQNFSYFIFKKRQQLLDYFKNAKKTLNDDGMFIVDCFGGSQCQETIEEETEHSDFSYFWDQDSFDPVTNYAQFYIHFKRKGEKKRKQVFSYDWRMWSIPEIREIMEEAGFEKTVVFWEGTDKDGEGDGEFTPVTKGEDCESWIAYIAGLN